MRVNAQTITPETSHGFSFTYEQTCDSIAGLHLIKAGTKKNTALILSCFGTGMLAVGAHLSSRESSQGASNALMVLGGSLLTISFVVKLNSNSHLIKAGQRFSRQTH